MADVRPAQDDPQKVTHSDNIHLVDREVFPYGTDLAFHGDLAVAGQLNELGGEEGARNSGIFLYQRQKDGTLEELGHAPCAAYHADVDFVGRAHVVQSHDTGDDNVGCSPGKGKEGLRVFDVRNPRKPKSVGFAETVHGAHNVRTLPGSGLAFVASYNLGDPSAVDGVSIVDVAANPENPPVEFLEFPDADDQAKYENMRNESGKIPTSIGCHDIGFDLDRETPLAFCAGVTETHIWDISNPRDPVIIEIIKNPAVSIHHGVGTNAAGDVLLVQDEWLGAAGANTGCLAPKQPSGAIWFYDISDPTNPVPLSYWSAPTPDPTEDYCTSHFFGTFTVPPSGQEGKSRDMVVTSYDDHGVWVVDFTDATAPYAHAFYEPDGANFWSAYPYKGRLYANSSAPRTLLNGPNPADADKGGVWVFKLDGYELPWRQARQKG